MRPGISLDLRRYSGVPRHPTTRYKCNVRLCLVALVTLFSCSISYAVDEGLIRIGTGGPKGTYYPIGGLIARAVSDSDGYKRCQFSDCDEPPIIAIHQASNGSIANAAGIQEGKLEAGLVQSDVAYWAFTGTGVSQDKQPADKLRAIASLYTESFHLVARKDANIRSVLDLKNKRVSLDEPGSGTLVDATILLNAYGLSPEDLEVEYIKPEIAKAKLLAGKLDAFFIVGGFPVSSITELAEANAITLVPVDGAQKANLLSDVKFFSENTIPANTYPNIAETRTLGVGALLLVSSELNASLIYNLTKKLWSDETRNILVSGHAKGIEITKENLQKGVSVPFHPGALAYYQEIDLPLSE